MGNVMGSKRVAEEPSLRKMEDLGVVRTNTDIFNVEDLNPFKGSITWSKDEVSGPEEKHYLNAVEFAPGEVKNKNGREIEVNDYLNPYDPDQEKPVPSNQIISYSASTLFTLGWMHSLFPGAGFSILLTKRVVFSICSLLLLCFLYAGGVCAKTHDDCDILVESGAGYGEECNSVFGDNNSVCFGHVTFNQGTVVGSLASFLLGLFNGVTLARWWSSRMALSTIQKKINTMAAQVGCLISDDREEYKYVIMRHLNLAHALIYLRARSNNDKIDYRILEQVMVKQGGEMQPLITPKEVEHLQNEPIPHHVVINWTVRTITGLGLAGKVHAWPAALNAGFISHINALREASDDVFCYINTQIPYAYTSLIALIIKFHELFIAVYCGTLVGSGYQGKDYSNIGWGLIILLVNAAVFEGVFEVHSILQNPLGDDENDFPGIVYHKATVISAGCILESSNPDNVPGEVKRAIKEGLDEINRKAAELAEKDRRRKEAAEKALKSVEDNEDGEDGEEFDEDDDDDEDDVGGDDGGGDDGGE